MKFFLLLSLPLHATSVDIDAVNNAARAFYEYQHLGDETAYFEKYYIDHNVSKRVKIYATWTFFVLRTIENKEIYYKFVFP